MKWLLLSLGYIEWLHRKYTIEGWLELCPEDIVVDCCAYVGGFSIAACELGCDVYAFEPSQDTFLSLQKNLGIYPNSTCHNLGLADHGGWLELNVSTNPVENSFLEPDTGHTISRQAVEAARLDEFSRKNGIRCIDFLKLEAEGFEIEVLKGCSEIKILKIAIDCSPERDGKSPAPEIIDLLVSRGYIVISRYNMVFAKLKNDFLVAETLRP